MPSPTRRWTASHPGPIPNWSRSSFSSVICPLAPTVDAISVLHKSTYSKSYPYSIVGCEPVTGRQTRLTTSRGAVHTIGEFGRAACRTAAHMGGRPLAPGSRRCLFGSERQQRDHPRALDRVSEQALVTGTRAGCLARKDLAAVVHKLPQLLVRFVVDIRC